MNFAPAVSVIEHDPRILAVYALGSAARDEVRFDSDIDLALLLAPGAVLPATELVALATRLTSEMGRPVDLGLLSSLNLVYTRQAVLAGRCIYRRSASLATGMVANWLGLYASFQDERREILDAYTTG